ISAATAPPQPPSGFQVPISWSPTDYKFEPKELWLHLVAFQSVLATYGKYQRMFGTDIYTLVLSKGAIVIQPFERATFGVMVWALLVVGVQMAQRYHMPERIPTLETMVGVGGVRVGVVGTYKPVVGVSAEAGMSVGEDGGGNGNGTVASMGGGDVRDVISLRTEDLGSISCEEDPDLIVHYRFAKRPLGPSQ
ncbi:MAG: hypothetical protein Q9169_008546, partial [Polycauliona sp. 2 TL-2023]